MGFNFTFTPTHAAAGAALLVNVARKAQGLPSLEMAGRGLLHVHLAWNEDDDPEEELKRFLAGVLQIAESDIEILPGARGSWKLVAFQGLTPEDLEQRLQHYLLDLGGFA